MSNILAGVAEYIYPLSSNEENSNNNGNGIINSNSNGSIKSNEEN